jgi:hypothetical protein
MRQLQHIINARLQQDLAMAQPADGVVSLRARELFNVYQRRDANQHVFPVDR